MNQGMILLHYLRQHGRTKCADLERLCDVRSVTTRMSELIRRGEPILKTCVPELDSRGRPRRATYYEIMPDATQGDLFNSP